VPDVEQVKVAVGHDHGAAGATLLLSPAYGVVKA
jgi:hypothetical protein